MKLKNILLSVFILSLFVLNIGCTKEYITEQNTEEHITEIIGTEIISEQITVKKSDWKWNDDYARFEAKFDVPHINEDVDIYGEVIVSTLISEGKENIWKFLPFSRVFYEEVIDEVAKEKYVVSYTEQFSFGYQVGKIFFYIENSDKLNKSEHIADEMLFKISSVLDNENIEY